MLFFGHGIIWDAENDKELAVFKNGEFETEDKAVQKKLIDLGFIVGDEDADDYKLNKPVTSAKKKPAKKPVPKKATK